MNRDSSRRILEAVVTTVSASGTMHVAPMGPEVSEAFDRWQLKPFQTSTTFQNLHRTGKCVVHVTDDALLMARAVLGDADTDPATYDPNYGYVLQNAAHWYALQVETWDVSQPRAIAECRVRHREIVRPFFGWNRAQHAIVELAIVASRIDRLEAHVVESELQRGRIMVEKTAGNDERQAFELLAKFIREGLSRRLMSNSAEPSA